MTTEKVGNPVNPIFDPRFQLSQKSKAFSTIYENVKDAEGALAWHKHWTRRSTLTPIVTLDETVGGYVVTFVNRRCRTQSWLYSPHYPEWRKK